MSTTFGSVQRTVDLPVPVGVVWEALTTGEHLSQWLGDDVRIDPFPGGHVAVRAGGALRRAVIVDFDPGRLLGLRWLPDRRPVGFVWPPDDAPAGEGGEVTFTLAAIPEGTRLTVVETAPAGETPRAMATIPAGSNDRGGSRPAGFARDGAAWRACA